ncbi:phage terminase small subunit [Puerhibacterium puerhi]|uniref:phage terminase small subunit n=1 Tax=Puerhibacterium puerhi TaxID=2692623 RepID=UPI00135AEEAF|nr:hypothetical protein [Puerhibacterium puerhi]
MPARPKRESELARPRERKGGDQQPTIHLELQPVTIPNIPKSWHPIARRMFEALKTSGQSARFQNSDWAFAYAICDEVSRYKHEEDRREKAIEVRERWDATPKAERDRLIAEGKLPKFPPTPSKGGSAMKLSALLDALGRLGMTEIDRLKARIELTEPAPEEDSAEVIAIDEARAALGLAQ